MCGMLFIYLMIIQSAAVLAKLQETHLDYTQDGSRHFLCPSCRNRTKLYTLKDGRKKCSVCVKKFDPDKKTDKTKLKQYADILVCFCLDFSAQQTSDLTKLRYRLVADCYKHFRILLAQQNLLEEQMHLLTTVEDTDRSSSESTVLQHTKQGINHKNTKKGDAPIFGVTYLKNGKIFIDVLRDDSIPFHFETIFNDKEIIGKSQYCAYAGFIRGGKFLRFSDTTDHTDGVEHFWSWMKERMLKHHGIRKKNTGLYLKELEWKYNHRLLSPKAQAYAIVDLMPSNFLKQWSKKTQKQMKSVQ
ncbi:hypothetical protein COU78_01255 [Candidatus Peregrinibacteria bacterium CG10_big_fil_rev_8_21_14_0_10_49_24]|nr:MAG: hypothetical protein COV83_04220 [Candidatus Peregrinibacteria bacterium CG11_big_fil_rev_8_21_14_0_20_49_14]PIR51354.1 MAG: hypothetical protein COU78_01255 [Candidatus Peregrinibacteria bacterium CG10_big_fil_rev_8_21_14_0_10_49_24]PJA68118.1 MAG: hypothetical protein CO157_01070 [Candidatus Peregrinibacteria bacterium CG_4_9_14_3_um_filter_49_12]